MQSSRCAQGLLESEDIDRNNKLLIDPNNVFWGLASGNNIDKDTYKKVFSLYSRIKDKLDVSMHNFRFKTELNSVYINPTDRCNADCPYCYIPAEKRKKGKELSSKDLEYILKKIGRYFSNNKKLSSVKPIIIYHGSEPLLVKDTIFSSILRL